MFKLCMQNEIYINNVKADPSFFHMKQIAQKVQLARQMAKQSGKQIVVVYCNEYDQTWWPNWGPNSMDTGGVGGSEEAVIFLEVSV